MHYTTIVIYSLHASTASAMEASSANRLKWSKYSTAYRGRLVEGARALNTFLSDHDYTWELIARGKSKQVYGILEQFVSQLNKSPAKGALRVAKHAILYVQASRPRLRKSLQNTWNILRGWEEQQPASFRPPMPLAILVVLLCEARQLAVASQDQKRREVWYVFSALMMVGFFGLLRPAEICAIRLEDVSLPSSWSLAGLFAVIRACSPKNARQMGRQQFTEIRQADTINWLSWVVHRRPQATSRLWPGETSTFRTMFRNLCQRLNLGSLRLSPASLRAGGATWMLDGKEEVSRIRFLGRWFNLRSLEHYLQVARAQQIAISLPHATTTQLKEKLCRNFFMLCLPCFLAAEVAPENLVKTQVREPSSLHDVADCIRIWGGDAEAVQKSHGGRRSSTRSELAILRSAGKI